MANDGWQLCWNLLNVHGLPCVGSRITFYFKNWDNHPPWGLLWSSLDYVKIDIYFTWFCFRHQDPVWKSWTALIVVLTMKHGSVMDILMLLQDSCVRYLLSDKPFTRRQQDWKISFIFFVWPGKSQRRKCGNIIMAGEVRICSGKIIWVYFTVRVKSRNGILKLVQINWYMILYISTGNIAAQRYRISLDYWKNLVLTCGILSSQEGKFCIFKWPIVMFYLLHKHQGNNKPFNLCYKNWFIM